MKDEFLPRRKAEMKKIWAYLWRRRARLCWMAMLGLLGWLAMAEILIRRAAGGRTYERAEQVPHHRAGLVLGCSKILANGRPNRFFNARVKAAAALHAAGKVDCLIVSGDNSRETYDEPTDLRDALVALGVPETAIYRDYAGFSTLDSVVRVREIFGQQRIVVVSQRFHNERALFLASAHGISAIGFNAKDVPLRESLRTRARESLARAATLVEVWILRRQPKFLGPPVPLDGPPN